MTRHAPLATFLLLVMAGCGGSPRPTPAAQAVAGGFSDPRLTAFWQQAQQAIGAQQFDLWAAYFAEGRTDHDWHTADPRALTMAPTGVTVTLVPDLTLAQLQAENPGVTLHCKADPCGVIHAPDGASATFCHSYTIGNDVFVAASLEFAADPMVYEFENVILNKLYYNTGGR